MNYLFSNKYKRIGWGLLVLGIALGMIYFFVTQNPEFLDVSTFAFVRRNIGNGTDYFSFIQDNIFDEICALLVIVGGLLAAFSKEKYEDEFIAKIRLDALVWATYFNYGVLLISVMFVYGFPFFWVLVFNMFTTLFIFLIKFNLALNKLKKTS